MPEQTTRPRYVLRETGVDASLADGEREFADLAAALDVLKETVICHRMAKDGGRYSPSLQFSLADRKEAQVVVLVSIFGDDCDEPACTVCGCSEMDACEGGCEWVDEDLSLCSACAGEGGA